MGEENVDYGDDNGNYRIGRDSGFSYFTQLLHTAHISYRHPISLVMICPDYADKCHSDQAERVEESSLYSF